MNKQSKTMRLTLMGLFAAVLLLMAYTPLGYLNHPQCHPRCTGCDHTGPCRRSRHGSCFRIDQLFAMHRRGRHQRHGSNAFWHQPCAGLHPAFHPQTSGRISVGICLPLQPQSRRRQNRLHDHRILQRIFQHRIFHVPFSTAVRQYFLCAGTDGW